MNRNQIIQAWGIVVDVINKANLWSDQREAADKAAADLRAAALNSDKSDCKCQDGFILQVHGHWYNTKCLNPPVDRPAVEFKYCPECGRKL
jgi:hypothetical protein